MKNAQLACRRLVEADAQNFEGLQRTLGPLLEIAQSTHATQDIKCEADPYPIGAGFLIFFAQGEAGGLQRRDKPLTTL